MMKHKTIHVALLIAVALSSCSDNPEVQKSPPPTVSVDFLIAENSSHDNMIRIPGTVLPFEHVDLFAEISGRLLSIHFTEGQQVKKGQLLFKLDTDILEAQLKQVQSDLDFAKKDEARKKALWEAKSISFEEYELAQSKKMNLEAQAQVLEVQISKGRVEAPFSGTVGLRQVSEGAFIGPTTQLTSIAQNDRVKIEFALAERYASAARPGVEVEFFSGKEKQVAKIYATAPAIDAQTRMLTVRAEVKSEQFILPGTFIDIHFYLESNEQSIRVPATALVPVLNGQKIWKMENGTAKSVMVTPGIRDKQDVEIFGDIKAGDTIILSGLLGMREGMNVTIKQP